MPSTRKIYFPVYAACGVVLLMLGANAWRPYTIIISNHTAEAYSSKCRVNSSFGDLRSPRFLDLNVELLTIIRNPFMHTELYFESDNGKFDMEVVNRTVDLCKFYKNKKYEPVVQVVFKLLEDYLTHWFSSCPMNKGTYYLKNVELNVEKLPPFFPEKSGMLDVVILDRQQPLYGVKVFFQILKTFKKT